MAFHTAEGQYADFLKKHDIQTYENALRYNDINVAIQPLHGYLAIDSNLNYKDTLSILYFNAKSYVSSLLLAEEVYKAQPDNVIAMARAAECYDEIGDPKTSVNLYEQVVPKTKNPIIFINWLLANISLSELWNVKLRPVQYLPIPPVKKSG